MTPIKLKIELKDTPHKIIRKVLVPENITMHQFHHIIQLSMGWENTHLYEFCDKKWKSDIRVGIPSEFDDEFFAYSPLRDSKETMLKEVFAEENEGKPFWYWYDFGDDWWHRISFLKPNKKELADFKGAVLCTDATGKCPPEDIGGPWGYASFLNMIKDKKHPEREEMMEWCGVDPDEKYDEISVDLEMINETLSRFK